MSSTVSAGWYPDPLGSAPLRWWDGQTWTTATSASEPGQPEHAAASSATPPADVGSGASTAQQPMAEQHRYAQTSYTPNPQFQGAHTQNPYAQNAHTQNPHTQNPYGAQTPGWPQPGAGVGYPTGYPQPFPPGIPPRQSSGNSNTFAFVALGVVAVYVLVAFTTGVVFFGIFPVLLAVRSVRAREPLAPLAIVAAVLAVGLALLLLA